MISFCWWKDLLWAVSIVTLVFTILTFGVLTLSRISCERTAVALGYDDHTFSLWTGCLVKDGERYYKLEQRRDNHLHELRNY